MAVKFLPKFCDNRFLKALLASLGLQQRSRKIHSDMPDTFLTIQLHCKVTNTQGMCHSAEHTQPHTHTSQKTHTHTKCYNSKNIKVVQRVKLIRLKKNTRQHPECIVQTFSLQLKHQLNVDIKEQLLRGCNNHTNC